MERPKFNHAQVLLELKAWRIRELKQKHYLSQSELGELDLEIHHPTADEIADRLINSVIIE